MSKYVPMLGPAFHTIDVLQSLMAVKYRFNSSYSTKERPTSEFKTAAFAAGAFLQLKMQSNAD